MRKHKQKSLVLIVDDEPQIRNGYRRNLGLKEVAVLEAATSEDGRRLFHKNREKISVIVLDYYLVGETTISLLREILDHFDGPIIATADDAESRKTMCKESSRILNVEKVNVPKKIFGILGLTGD